MEPNTLEYTDDKGPITITYYNENPYLRVGDAQIALDPKGGISFSENASDAHTSLKGELSEKDTSQRIITSLDQLHKAGHITSMQAEELRKIASEIKDAVKKETDKIYTNRGITDDFYKDNVIAKPALDEDARKTINQSAEAISQQVDAAFAVATENATSKVENHGRDFSTHYQDPTMEMYIQKDASPYTIGAAPSGMNMQIRKTGDKNTSSLYVEGDGSVTIFEGDIHNTDLNDKTYEKILDQKTVGKIISAMGAALGDGNAVRPEAVALQALQQAVIRSVSDDGIVTPNEKAAIIKAADAVITKALPAQAPVWFWNLPDPNSSQLVNFIDKDGSVDLIWRKNPDHMHAGFTDANKSTYTKMDIEADGAVSLKEKSHKVMSAEGVDDSFGRNENGNIIKSTDISLKIQDPAVAKKVIDAFKAMQADLTVDDEEIANLKTLKDTFLSAGCGKQPLTKGDLAAIDAAAQAIIDGSVPGRQKKQGIGRE